MENDAKPSDYVISTGKQYSVKEFVNFVLKELQISYTWRGSKLNAKCFDKNGNCIIACDKNYYRPLEVDTLLGDATKAQKELKWKPKTNIKQLVKEMVRYELKKLSNDKKKF